MVVSEYSSVVTLVIYGEKLFQPITFNEIKPWNVPHLHLQRKKIKLNMPSINSLINKIIKVKAIKVNMTDKQLLSIGQLLPTYL